MSRFTFHAVIRLEKLPFFFSARIPIGMEKHRCSCSLTAYSGNVMQDAAGYQKGQVKHKIARCSFQYGNLYVGQLRGADETALGTARIAGLDAACPVRLVLPAAACIDRLERILTVHCSCFAHGVENILTGNHQRLNLGPSHPSRLCPHKPRGGLTTGGH